MTPAPSAPTAVASRAEVRLGEPFGVVVEVRHDAAQRYAISAEQPAGPFAVVGGGCTTRSGALASVTRCELDLALLDLGTHSPVLRLDGAGPAGEWSVEVTATPVSALLATDPGVPASEIPMRGMPPPVPLFVPTWEPLAWIGLGAAVALAAAVWAVRRLLARLREAESRRAATPPEPIPSEELEARLDELEAAGADASPEWFFELSRAIREYLAALSPAATLDRTTAEVVGALRASPVGGLDVDRFAAFASELDRAKYGGPAPGPDAWRRALADARDLLDATRPPRWDPDEEARRG